MEDSGPSTQSAESMTPKATIKKLRSDALKAIRAPQKRVSRPDIYPHKKSSSVTHSLKI